MKYEGKEKLYKISYRLTKPSTWLLERSGRFRTDFATDATFVREQFLYLCGSSGQPPHSINNETRDRSAGRTRDCGCAPSPVQDYLSRIDRSGSDNGPS